MSNPMWAFDVADALMERDGVPKAQRFYRQTEYVRRALAGETADAPGRSATPAPVPMQEAAPIVAVTRPDPWARAISEVNGEVAAHGPEASVKEEPEAPAATKTSEANPALGAAWERALSEVNRGL